MPVGGHTEITAAVTQPLVSGTMLGVLRRADLRDKRGAREGDRIMLTKAVAVEGTALLATELGERLLELGMGEDELRPLPRLRRAAQRRARGAHRGELRRRARHARRHRGRSGDGARRAGRRLRARGRRGPRTRSPSTARPTRLCALLGADPLGLIGSGSLLICCAPERAGALLEALRAAGIAATDIGEVGRPGAGVSARADGRPVPWPVFAVDEAARLLAGAAIVRRARARAPP